MKNFSVQRIRNSVFNFDCPSGQITLWMEMFDDVKRHYRISIGFRRKN